LTFSVGFDTIVVENKQTSQRGDVDENRKSCKYRVKKCSSQTDGY